MPKPKNIKQLYARRIEQYARFSGFFRTRQGLRWLFERGGLLRPGMRVLDAGCGYGLATFALLDAMHAHNIVHTQVDAFDLTPAMLDRFRGELKARDTTQVCLHMADALDDAALPPDWSGYDLVISTSMLEYLPRSTLPRVLAAWRARMAPGARVFIMITRRSLESKVLIEWGWHAERYAADELRDIFDVAGFDAVKFVRFPLRYGWLNRANHVIVAH